MRFLSICLILFLATFSLMGCATTTKQPTSAFIPEADYKILTQGKQDFPEIIANDDYIAVEAGLVPFKGMAYTLFDAKTLSKIEGESTLDQFPGGPLQGWVGITGDNYARVSNNGNERAIIEGVGISSIQLDENLISAAARYRDYIIFVSDMKNEVLLKRYDMTSKKVKVLSSFKIQKISGVGTVLGALGAIRTNEEHSISDVACTDDGKIFFALTRYWMNSKSQVNNYSSTLYVFDMDGKKLTSIQYPDDGLGGNNLGFIGLNNYKENFIVGPVGKKQLLSAKLLTLKPIENQEYLMGFNHKYLFFTDGKGTIYYK